MCVSINIYSIKHITKYKDYLNVLKIANNGTITQHFKHSLIMNIRNFIANIGEGLAIPMGFNNPYKINPEFLNAMLKAGEKGIECVLQPDSSFEVSTRMINKEGSPADKKLMGNISVKLSFGALTSNVYVSIGALAAIVEKNGTCSLMAFRPLNAEGAPLSSKNTGEPIYNIVPVNASDFSKESMDKIISYVEGLQNDEIGAPNVQGGNAGKK